MSYDSHTGRILCDICGSENQSRKYTSYQVWMNGSVKHICNECHARGAYFCRACEDVHTSPDGCPQPPLPAQLDGR